jgi:four helix bundle protein
MQAKEKPFDINDRTFDFGTEIIKLCQALEIRSGGIRLLSSQLFRSGTSVGANVEEAYCTSTDPDFISKFSIALKESRETSFWLRQIIAAEFLPKDEVEDIIGECEEIKKILASIIIKKSKMCESNSWISSSPSPIPFSLFAFRFSLIHHAPTPRRYRRPA